MTLLARLRTPVGMYTDKTQALANEAADEIERLRAYIANLDGKYVCLDGGRDEDGRQIFIDDGIIVASDIIPNEQPAVRRDPFEQGGISDRLSNFDSHGNRTREKS
jgi:hypothetical protein